VKRRPDWFGTGYTVVWLTVWTAAILVAVWRFGGAALEGEAAAALVLAIWLAAAGLALYTVTRNLVRRLRGDRTPRAPHRNHSWDDGFGPPAGPEQIRKD
jgi:hypothetical protein